MVHSSDARCRVAQTDSHAGTQERLQQQGISTRPGTHACHMLGLYRDRFHLEPGDFPGARDCDAQTMAIPLHNRMSAEDFQYVASALREIG